MRTGPWCQGHSNLPATRRQPPPQPCPLPWPCCRPVAAPLRLAVAPVLPCPNGGTNRWKLLHRPPTVALWRQPPAAAVLSRRLSGPVQPAAGLAEPWPPVRRVPGSWLPLPAGATAWLVPAAPVAGPGAAAW